MYRSAKLAPLHWLRGYFCSDVALLVLAFHMLLLEDLVMENHFPSPDENRGPKDSELRYIDFINNPGWQQFLRVARQIDSQLSSFDSSKLGSGKMLDEYDDRVATYFGTGYDGQKAKVIGIADVVDNTGTPTGEQKRLSHKDDLIFNGVIIYPINDSWRVRLEFAGTSPDDDMQSVYYYIPPDEDRLTYLLLAEKTQDETATNTSENILVSLKNDIKMLVELTSSDAFLQLPTAKQHEKLNTETAILSGKFLRFYPYLKANISCTKFYALHDDMRSMNLTWEECYTDQSVLESNEQFIVSGAMLKFVYPEQLGNPKRHFDKPKDFDLGFGAPCLSVYDRQQCCQYYIVTDSITHIDSPVRP